MAIFKPEYYAETTRQPLPRLQPNEGPGSVMTRQFAADLVSVTARVILPVGTPVFLAAATGLVAKIIPGSATAQEKQVYGFIWPAPVDISPIGGGETLGTVMVRGSAHFADIEALRVAGTLAGTAQQLEDVFRDPITRERGLTIEALNLQGGNAGL